MAEPKKEVVVLPAHVIRTLSSHLAISDDAKKLIRHIPDFDLDDFCRHFLREGIPAGTGNVLGYLMEVAPKEKAGANGE